MPDLILFDLDGTLSDPLEGFARSMNYSLVHFGFAARDNADFAQFVGPPIEQAFHALTGSENRADIAAMIAKYRERYSDQGFAENLLYPGVPEALQVLDAAGIAMAVCTSKRRDFAERIVSMFGLRAHFRFISGGDVGIEKWQQMEALRAEGKVSNDSIMVGDRAVDLIAAHRNGLRAAGVLWGYGSREELAAQTPLHLFDAPAQLIQLAGGPGRG